ncbi:hypothetical protein H5410_016563 [Solanum commersonii]|uniref:Uncharacterized protein n=1 Tax=Solanum commersonii TaxID=4109 RepID=A0A9J5ZXC6_SOLCO|nr:hypothetical protein H5410_016563 [Solanum commersonii]
MKWVDFGFPEDRVLQFIDFLKSVLLMLSIFSFLQLICGVGVQEVICLSEGPIFWKLVVILALRASTFSKLDKDSIIL